GDGPADSPKPRIVRDAPTRWRAACALEIALGASRGKRRAIASRTCVERGAPDLRLQLLVLNSNTFMAVSHRQLDLQLSDPPPRWRHGGARPGAGRPKAKVRHVVHLARPEHVGRHPVEVTMRARGGLHTFRCQRVLFAFTEAIAKANQRAL